MLDKARNHLIACAFRKANITSLESDPTPAEIEDAAHTLNVMLQSWNNDGFRLFKIKDAYMPFLPNVNEYSLKSQAYKSFEKGTILSFEKISATRLKLKDFSNISAGQKIIIINNVEVHTTIKTVDFEAKEAILEKPIVEPLLSDDIVFFGDDFTVAKTEAKTFESAFQTISYSDFDVIPNPGDIIWFNYNGNWIKRDIYSVDATNQTLTLTRQLSPGSISNAYIAYGTNVYQSYVEGDYALSPRLVRISEIKEIPTAIGILSDAKMSSIYNVESVEFDNDVANVVLTTPLTADALEKLGVEYINANGVYAVQTEVLWRDLQGLVPVEELDWGLVTETAGLETDDWGSILDAPSVLEDWGTLTGGAVITGFAKDGNDMYVTVYSDETESSYLFHKSLSAAWEVIDTSLYNLTKSRLYIINNAAYLADESAGVYVLSFGTLNEVYTSNGVEEITRIGNTYYLISPKASGTTNRTVVSTDSNFNQFSSSWTISLDSIANPAEFLGKLYIGSTDTFVTDDMKDIMNINIYAENRSVIGDRLLNMNINQYCSFTKDGINFQSMPLMLSMQSAWGYKDGCTFIAIYGVMIDGVVGTQIYMANDFNPTWTPQARVKGRVFDMQFDSRYAYFISDVEVQSLEYRTSVEANEEVTAYVFGEQIGRPQELMNVMKYSLLNTMQLPMNALALKDFTLLPHDQLNGEPVNYCFMREAEDGKLMVWGTPNKFGEYLKFSYVEPITLLEGARSTPDFPDEYYEAVEDGLAAQLAAQYGAPIERQELLVARAQESKENAMLHDNEDTSYNIAPNERWG